MGFIEQGFLEVGGGGVPGKTPAERLLSELRRVGFATILIPGIAESVKFDAAGTIDGVIGASNARINNLGTAGSFIALTTGGTNPFINTYGIYPSGTNSTVAPANSSVSGLANNTDRLYGLVFAKTGRSAFPDNPNGVLHHGGTTATNGRYLQLALGTSGTDYVLRFGSSATPTANDATFTVPKTSLNDTGYHVAVMTYNTVGIRTLRFDGVDGVSGTASLVSNSATLDSLEVIPVNRLGNNANSYVSTATKAVAIDGDLSKLYTLEAALMDYATRLNAGEE